MDAAVTASVQRFSPRSAFIQFMRPVYRERMLIEEFLTDTLGATSSTAGAGGSIRKRVEHTLHFPLLAFPTAVRALS